MKCHGIKTFLFSFCLNFFGLGCADYNLGELSSHARLSVKIEEYCPTEGFQYRELFVFNASTKLNKYQQYRNHAVDYDRDGLSDLEEMEVGEYFNVSFLSPDTNQDGFSDLIVQTVGLDRENQEKLIFLCDVGSYYQDTDQDGLDNCSERFMKYDELNPDFDGDGIPDGLEVRFGTNPDDSFDAQLDVDEDGLSNLEEIKLNTPINFTNDEFITSLGMTYTSEAFAAKDKQLDSYEDVTCYDFQIDNISLSETDNGNLIEIRAMEKKLIEGQGEVSRIKTLILLIPNGYSSTLILQKDIDNRYVDGFLEPLGVQ